MLWAGYRREEASWVAEEDVTAAAFPCKKSHQDLTRLHKIM